jgi:hypothetical protein
LSRGGCLTTVAPRLPNRGFINIRYSTGARYTRHLGANMKQRIYDPRSQNGKDLIERLFAESTVLVQVAFPFTGSDWYLMEEAEEFFALLNRLGPGIPIYLNPRCRFDKSAGNGNSVAYAKINRLCARLASRCQGRTLALTGDQGFSNTSGQFPTRVNAYTSLPEVAIQRSVLHRLRNMPLVDLGRAFQIRYRPADL